MSRKTGITASHISQFRNGKGGAVSHTTLEQMLQAMEELAPWAKIYFCQLLAGISSAEFLVNSDRSDLRSLIVQADPVEQVEVLRLIAEILAKNIRNNPDIVEFAEAV